MAAAISRATPSMKLKSTEPSGMRRRGHGDENDVGFLDAFRSGRLREVKPAGGDVFA